eukprot:TRINITY_DN3538_c0_g1_i1.p1 TRINITY_DN3538_c0_g1~~TRINITY_DN3538_c0_g1_i1.p1  ORF type:complete len:450 (+),score=88.04 TRINITY_DN3538_c0_g1_i1:54-1403(+)
MVVGRFFVEKLMLVVVCLVVLITAQMGNNLALNVSSWCISNVTFNQEGILLSNSGGGVNTSAYAWLRQKYNMEYPLNVSFSLNATTGSDGFAFVIQQDPSGCDASGIDPGRGLGYEGLRGALAIEFDYHGNPELYDPGNFTHIGVQASLDPTSTILPIHNDTHVLYSPHNFSLQSINNVQISISLIDHNLTLSINNNTFFTGINTSRITNNLTAATIGFTSAVGLGPNVNISVANISVFNAPNPSLTPTVSLSPSRAFSTIYNLLCNNQSSSSTCIVSQPLDLGASTLLFNYSVVVVQSNVVLQNSSQVILQSSQQIQATGSVLFGGNLRLLLSTDTNLQLASSGGVFVPLFNYSSKVDGEFNSIVVENDESGCGVNSSPQYGERSMGVLLQARGCGGGSKLSQGAIAGIVIGSLCGAFICIVGIVAIGVFIAIMIRKDKSGSGSINLG